MIKGLVFICIIVSNIQKHQCFSLPTPPSLRQRRSSINSKLSSHQQLFLDTASVEQWERQIPLGIFHGITTNPVLLERAKVPCELESLKNLAHVALHEFKMEVFMIQSWGGTTDTLVRNALYLQDISDKIVVKIPLTREGVEAAAILKRQQVRLCMTACFTPHQVFTSACLGAEYVAPYLGRITDSGKNGIDAVIQMQRIVEGLRSDTRVFVASLRSADQLAVLAAAGLHTFTFSPQIADELCKDPLTIAAAADFERAAK